MNEKIDMAFVGAKIASRNNVTADLIVHSLSAGYNIAQMAHYRYLIAENQMALNNGFVSTSLNGLEQYKRELAKHAFLSVIDVVSLICKSIAGLKRE